MDMSPDIIFLLKSTVKHLLKEEGKEPDSPFDERFKIFRLEELISSIGPVHIQKGKIYWIFQIYYEVERLLKGEKE